MAETVLGIVIVALAFVGLLCVAMATVKHFEAKAKKPTPTECVHEWEPWSEPKETEVESKSFYGFSGQTTAKEYIGKFQDRVCSKCNVYERRWA